MFSVRKLLKKYENCAKVGKLISENIRGEFNFKASLLCYEKYERH